MAGELGRHTAHCFGVQSRGKADERPQCGGQHPRAIVGAGFGKRLVRHLEHSVQGALPVFEVVLPEAPGGRDSADCGQGGDSYSSVCITHARCEELPHLRVMLMQSCTQGLHQRGEELQGRPAVHRGLAAEERGEALQEAVPDRVPVQGHRLAEAAARLPQRAQDGGLVAGGVALQERRLGAAPVVVGEARPQLRDLPRQDRRRELAAARGWRKVGAGHKHREERAALGPGIQLRLRPVPGGIVRGLQEGQDLIYFCWNWPSLGRCCHHVQSKSVPMHMPLSSHLQKE
mmetsp:Transcript_35672/g.100286  ORF Transcript_35672/g.100286 Transcript_35672/m.100286 type:complete len:288 (+) Transcript_35672:776-1639(+)